MVQTSALSLGRSAFLVAALSACGAPAGAPVGGDSPPKTEAPFDASAFDVIDLRLAAPQFEGDPFGIQLTGVFSGPAGRSLEVPGFYDGDGQWVLRFSPPTAGEWSYTTRSTEPSIDGRHDSLTVGPSREGRHGGLRVASRDRHRFEHEDGTPTFLLGYEADWLWALGLGDQGITRVRAFLDKIEEAGFSQVSVNVFAKDTRWCPSKGSCGSPADDFGPAPLDPWEGPTEAPDHPRFDLNYWRNLDRVVSYADSIGLTTNLQFRAWNKAVAWPEPRSEADDRYFDLVVARYAAFNVTWDFSKESFVTAEQDEGYIADRMTRVGARDPYQRPRTANHLERHWGGKAAHRPWLDFFSQQTHGEWHRHSLEQRAVLGLPILVAEYGYELGPGGAGDVTFPGAAGQGNQSADEMARRALEIITAGAYPGYYYAYTAWDVLRPGDDPPGYARFQRIAKVMRSTRFWELEPRDDLADSSGAMVLARPGLEYVVYPPEGGSFRLDVSGAASPLPVRWLNVSSGTALDGPPVGDGKATLTPPADLGEGVLLVHVGSP